MMNKAEVTEQGAADSRALVGIDIGGTGIRILAMTPGGKILSHRALSTPQEFPGETAVEFLSNQIDEVAEKLQLIAIGIGASGPIDSLGTIQNPDTVPGFTGAPLVRGLTDVFKIPVIVDNDAVCAAIAEQQVGAGRGRGSLLHVTLGTGIGAAFIRNGMAFQGGDGAHPESGHISVSGVSAECYCGRTSCWEQSASRQSLQRTASKILGLQPSDKTAIATIAILASGGDANALRAFTDYGDRVSDGLSTLMAVYRPDTVVLGGSGAENFNLYAKTIEDNLRKLGEWIPTATVFQTELDDYGGAIGAALLAKFRLEAISK